MSNHYAEAIDIIVKDLNTHRMRMICVEFAKRHPKAFVEAAKGVKYTSPADSGEKEDDEQ